ncbi:UNVERIFIED_CONTAM: hypothetical protein Sradi_6178600 [Sesamum radiatum]|uniref:Uncharacterized protein n=1 Tax=Sesamum radiatum TaxID=300843 RepID=A0AAW2K8S1_SESRA
MAQPSNVSSSSGRRPQQQGDVRTVGAALASALADARAHAVHYRSAIQYYSAEQ